MIEISVPNRFIPEIRYVIYVIFDEILGLKYDLKVKNQKDYTLSIDNKNNLIICDSFFGQFNDGLDYLKQENIPEKVQFLRNDFLTEKDIPVLFGTPRFEKSKEKIFCGIDIFASCFFMLSRWEEYVKKNKDRHNRFPGYASLGYKEKFLSRPIVNEYIEMLWGMMKYLGYKGKRKKRKFQIIPTHDIDDIYLPFTLRSFLRDVLKKKSICAFKKRLHYMYEGQNPFDTFDYLMDLSEKYNLKSRFYFMNRYPTYFNDNYKISDSFVKGIISKIMNRNHIIGFHSSYYTSKKAEQLKKEKNGLENELGIVVKEGRVHYLKFENPFTWRIWNENKMELDSTMGYVDYEGFRCGTADEFSVFDILSRNKLSLKERPLIVMDGTLKQYRKLDTDESFKILNAYKDICNKYSMPYTILFHNSSFDDIQWIGWKDLYNSVLAAQNKKEANRGYYR